MITVNFHEIGRDKKSWSKQFKIASGLAIAKEARRNGGIMSSDIDAIFADNYPVGYIIAGWSRVGTFTITRP